MRIRRDRYEPQSDGAKLWYADWMGGPSLAAIEHCRLPGIEGDMRRLVEITGEPDTWFSIPATCRIADCHVRGFVSNDDNGNLVFHPVNGG